MLAFDPWHDDMLGRKDEASAVLRFIHGRIEERLKHSDPASYVLNLNSQWGHGKTFFLERLRQDLQNGGAAVAFVNAWETDFSDDPMTAIMSAIDEALKPFLSRPTIRNAWKAAVRSGAPLVIGFSKKVGGKLLSKYAGDFADDLFDAAFNDGAEKEAPKKPDDPLGVEKGVEEVVDKLADSALERVMQGFRTQLRSVATFKSQLTKVAKSLQQNGKALRPIYVLVDELDRCRPLYAIRMLEAVKHLFNAEGVVFIVGTDTEQLSQSVKAVYGASFDSDRYLYRFFDRTYRLRKPESAPFIKYLYAKNSIDVQKLAYPHLVDLSIFTLRFFEDFDCSLRDIEQCFDMLHTVCTMWDKKAKIQLGYLLALIILYHFGRKKEYGILSGQVNAPFDSPIITTPSVILSHNVGSYNEPSRLVTGSTKTMIDAYKTALARPLTEYVNGSTPKNPVDQWVFEQMREEFHILHSTLRRGMEGPFSVIRDYAGYLELAVRFETDEASELASQ